MKSPGNGFLSFSTALWLPRWPPRAGHLHAFSTAFAVISPLSLFVPAAWWCRSGWCRAGNTATLPAGSRCGGERDHTTLARMYLRNWSRTLTIRRALPLPVDIIVGMIGVAAVQDKWALCGAMYIGYLGLLRTGELQGVWSYLSLTRRGPSTRMSGSSSCLRTFTPECLLRRLEAGKAAADSVFGLSYTDLKQGLETTVAAVGVCWGHSYALRTAAGWGHLPFLTLYVAGPHYVLRPLGECGDCAALHLTSDQRSRVGQAATRGPRPRRALCTNLPGAAQSAGVARKDRHLPPCRISGLYKMVHECERHGAWSYHATAGTRQLPTSIVSGVGGGWGVRRVRCARRVWMRCVQPLIALVSALST